VLVELDRNGKLEFLGIPPGGGETGPGLGWLTSHPILLAIAGVVLAAASIAARRNWKLGRMHAGSFRICAFFFSLFMLHWLLVAHHVASYWELYLLAMGILWASFIVGAFWILYAAVEPNIRRTFPAALISWHRMVQGCWGDPLAGSAVLGGITIRMASLPVLLLLLRLPAKPAIQALAGPGWSLGYGLAAVELGSAIGLITISTLLVLRRLIRRKGWPTAGLIALGGLASAAGGPAACITGALNIGLGVWTVNRFGWLGLLAGNVALQLFLWTPVNLGPGYTALWVPHLAAILFLAGWGFFQAR
jgi:hypothetical protein